MPDFWGLPTRVRDIDEVRSPKAFKDVAANNWVSDAAGVLSPEQVQDIRFTYLHALHVHNRQRYDCVAKGLSAGHRLRR